VYVGLNFDEFARVMGCSLIYNATESLKSVFGVVSTFTSPNLLRRNKLVLDEADTADAWAALNLMMMMMMMMMNMYGELKDAVFRVSGLRAWMFRGARWTFGTDQSHCKRLEKTWRK
jgi:hypothetical protein